MGVVEIEEIVRSGYTIVLNHEERRAEIHVSDRDVRRKIRAPMLYSYDGYVWLKVSGGRRIYFQDVVRKVGLEPDDARRISEFFSSKEVQ